MKYPLIDDDVQNNPIILYISALFSRNIFKNGISNIIKVWQNTKKHEIL